MICTHTVGAEYPCVKALDALWRPYELRTAHDGHRRGDAPIVRPYEPVRAEGELVLLETKEAGRQRAKDRHRLEVLCMTNDAVIGQQCDIRFPLWSVMSQPDFSLDTPHIDLNSNATIKTCADRLRPVVSAARPTQVCAMRVDSHSRFNSSRSNVSFKP